MSTSDSSLFQACIDNKKHLVKSVNSDNINYVSPISGNTPLHQACYRGWLDVVKLLIETYGCDSNVTNKHHESPLDYAKRYSNIDVVSYLQRASLYWACFQGRDEHVLKLINPDSINYVHPDHGDTPLHQACRQGWLDVVKLLIEIYGCDLNVTNKYHQSPLDYAKQYGKIDVVTYINSSLYQACFRGNKHLVLKLVNPDSVNYVHPSSGDTPLHQACKNGWLDVVKLLIEKYGCDSNVYRHQSPLDHAKRYGNTDVVSYLQRINSSLYWACAQGNKHLVLKLINQDNVNCVHPDHDDTPLHQACKRGCLDIVKLLIEEYGCNPNVLTTKSNQSVLHYACRYGHIDIIKYLIDKQHLNPLLKDSVDQLEPLDYAINYNKTAIAVYLCQHCISSDEMLNPNRIKTTINLIKYILGANQCDLKLKTANGDNILELVGSSKTWISHISSAAMLKILNSGNAKYIVVEPECKTSDGDNILELACQSEIFLSRIPSGLILKWLGDATISQVKKSIPDSRTADGDTLIQLVYQSEIYTSHISTVVLSKWLSDTTVIQNLTDIITPKWKTADGDTLLQLVCQSETILSQISATVLTKWLSDSFTTLNLVKIIVTPDLRTADGFTFFQLVCQSEKCLIQMPSTIFSKWLRKTPLEFVSVPMPDCEMTDGVTFLQLILHSEMSISQTSSMVLSKLLSNSRDLPINHMKMVDPNWKTLDGVHFLDVLCRSKVEDKVIIELMQHFNKQQNPDVFLDSDENTALHIACQASKPALVSYLVNKAQCDPNIENKAKSLPIDMTIDLEVINCLCQCDQVAIFSKTVAGWMNNESLSIATMLEILQLLVYNRRYKTKDGSTLLHVACTLSTILNYKIILIDFLLTKGQCDPNCLDTNGKMPLQLTLDSRIMIKLIQHGAKMTADVVFKLITSNITDSLIKEMLSLSIRKQAILWNPNELNDDGYTALHLACKDNNPTRVNILLSVAHCDPNIMSDNEEVPLQMTTNTEIIKDLIRHGAKTGIMYASCQNYLGTNKPVQPPVKVFIVGNPSVGKSTLTAALKKEISVIARIFSGKVSGVDRKTVGIVPHDLKSKIFGRVTLYDFAGQREFYSGHAALLQTAIQSTPPVFLLVVNLCEQEDEIVKNILYWVSFLENQCASVSCKPHIILVGSHADILKGTNPNDKVKMITDSLKKNNYCFTNMEYIGFVAMNCQYHESARMNELRHLLIISCDKLRIQEPITFNAHCFLVFLIDKFMNLTAVRIKTISEWVDNHISEGGILEFLPKGIETLYKICIELNDRGHILLLKDRIAIENSSVVIDKDFLLSKISGTVFAPEGFKQYKKLSTNTGVVPLSKIKECFPGKDLDILIGFLTHLEFCHEISDQDLYQLISTQYSQGSSEHYYLFPGLISLKADDTVWNSESKYNYNFRWILKCTHPGQFFSSRFLQVLLLRLAFSFALEKSFDNSNQSYYIDDSSNWSIGIHRNCCLWKNGISWGSVFGMQTLVEVTPDNKSVVLLARFQDTNLLRCVQHRSRVFSTILQCKKQFCPRLFVVELFIDSSSPLQYPLNLTNELNICTLQDLATAIMSDCECPSVVLQSNPIPAKSFVSFEPYLEMKLSTIQELWDETNENIVVSETFLSKFVQKPSGELSSFIKTFTESSATSASEDQLYQDLLKWRDNDKKKQKTYKDLRQKVDEYSVFGGRNVLELTGKLPKILIPGLMEKEKEEKQHCKLRVRGIKPKLRELQLLKFPDGNELRIIDTVAPKWKQVAVALGFDGPRIETIEMGALRQPGDACMKMFIEWLSRGRDLTWDSLIQSLKAANITEIANLLNNTIEIEAEDASARTSSTVTADSESQVATSTTTPDVINNSVKVKSSKCENESLGLIDQNIDSELSGPSQAEQGPGIATIPNIRALEVMEGRGGREVRVIESIGSQWEEVAKALDMGQEGIDMIKARHSDNDEEACREMLATWLQGNNGEVSWTAFSQALIDAGLPELADSLKDVLKLVL